MAATRDQILAFLDAELEIERYRDYGPIGLQVVGADDVERVAVAVSSTLEVFERAAAFGAQLLVVHHGLFWDRDPRVVGPLLRRRLTALFGSNLTLAAYHLPLDGHPVLGNNAQLAAALGLEVGSRFGEHGGVPIAVRGRLREPMPVAALAELVERVTGRRPLVLPGGPDPVQTLGVCSGGAGGDVVEAAALGLDAFLTGEAEEPSRGLALELGISFLAAGHHATETFGVRAVGGLLERRFDMETTFIDVPNPV
jgi:dinuclear metal center YbgI/SA1388 family protein